MFLLDTNVVFAAVVQAHLRHEPVSVWLSNIESFATCGLTQIGVFRLLVMEAAMHGHPLEPGDAHNIIDDFTSDRRHSFLGCGPISLEFVGRTRGHKAAFDDYLVQIAHSGGYKLATLDQPLSARWPQHTMLIEAPA